MKNVQLAILWHFHQPVYYEDINKPAFLPWVRLHALKDYYDMLKTVQSYPGLRMTFNFTPSLLEQLIAYDRAILTDHFLEISKKPAKTLSPEERVEILKNFFLANWTNMIQPYPHYYSLLLKRGMMIHEEELPGIVATFSDQDFTDLQVWFNLIWIDPSLRADLKYLYDKGHNFTEEDKRVIFEYQKKIMHAILPEYKSACESGQVEITTSPFYHPIMPLLVNSRVAQESNPLVSMPKLNYAYEEDCREQIHLAIQLFRECFGRTPSGLWPPEGSVSEAIIPLIKDFGIDWIATDESILSRSSGINLSRDDSGLLNRPGLLYRAHQFGDVKIFFRDHQLSDLIGFTYYAWEPEKAADDLVNRIKRIADSLTGNETYIVSIILDGENAWESYPEDGNLFLNAFYRKIVEERIETTTFTDYLKRNPAAPLPRLFPGSWIDANFNTWIGAPEKNRAWEMLAEVRQVVKEKNCTDPEVLKAISILEASDWYWWFGKDEGLIVEEFDELFRRYIQNIYRRLNLESPSYLYCSVATEASAAVKPVDLIHPTIDGRVTNYLEWWHAGEVDLQKTGGTMHRFASFFSKIFYGFDEKNIYLRADVNDQNFSDYQFRIEIFRPTKKTLVLGEEPLVKYAALEILEICLPFAAIDREPVTEVALLLRVFKNGIEVDRSSLLEFKSTAGDLDLEEWSA